MITTTHPIYAPTIIATIFFNTKANQINIVSHCFRDFDPVR